MARTSETKTIYIVPLKFNPVFPGYFTTIEVAEKLDNETIEKAGDNGFGLLLLRPCKNTPKNLTISDFYSVGTFVRTKDIINTIFGSKSYFIETLCKFMVREITCTKGIIEAKVKFIEEEPITEEENNAYVGVLQDMINKRDDKGPLFDHLKFNTLNIPQAVKLADYMGSVFLPREEQQNFLETLSIAEKVPALLKSNERYVLTKRIEKDIQTTLIDRLHQMQQEQILREQLSITKMKLESLRNARRENITELTDEDIKESILNSKKLIDRLKALNLTGEAYDTVFKEYAKYESLDSMNPEYSVLRNYLETVADLPWNTFSEENFSLEDAKAILEKDHYGIKEVKDRILEFLAVRKLKNDTKGSIICLIGPPGTGKTSVGVSIAKALNKKYYRFSVGGMHDEAEIKGHRRTYIGAMPGQIIKGLKVTKTKNPVFVIDEIDKMTISNQGDPASALLEVLDPEQNNSFRDHYLDIPFDASNILFIVTANSTDGIPRPLLDRMECIQLSGYTSEEKLHIGKRYLVPKSREKHGLKAKDIKYSDTILRKIAEEYAREAGVRNFEKALDRIHRKVATEIVSKQVTTPVVIDQEKLIHYLDQPIFHEDELIKAEKPGMSIGLAWTSMGGDVLAIEAQHIPGKGELKLTGQLGDVMKESANIALSYIKSISEKHGIKESFFSKNNIHLHVPEGATPKDGPSAGITMATAIYSLITNQVMEKDMAMTGELTLLGKVMPIGGLKEKVLAAKRNKIKKIIIPKHNKRDLDKLDAIVTKGLKIYLVGDMEEVLKLAFPNEKI